MEGKKVNVEDIASVIPKGHKNARTLPELVDIFSVQGWLDGNADPFRETRRLIERTSYDYVIINLQDGKGYFRPTKDDLDGFRQWIKQMESRRNKISKRISVGRGLFEDYLRRGLEEQAIKDE